MVKSICFYNNFHNGDIHVSRGFIKFALEQIPQFKNCNVFYSHRNPSNILQDLNIKHIPYNDFFEKHWQDGFFIENDTIYINTWYASDFERFYKTLGVTFDCLYFWFSYVFKQCFNFDISNYDPQIFLPVVDFSKINTTNIDSFLKTEKRKMVFISNGSVESYQSNNMDLNGFINTISDLHENVLFLLSNKMHPLINKKNVIYTSDIIKSDVCDLNENAYLSCFCDIIFGRSSGAFTFCFNSANISRDVKMLSFTNFQKSINNKYWLGEHLKNRINYKCELLNYNDENVCFMVDIINRKII